jgi:hypothetical protein
MATCAGPAGLLMDDIKLLLNDRGVKDFASEAELLTLLNQVHELIAQEGYWRTMTTFSSTASTWEYDLTALVSDYVKLESLWWEGTGDSNSYFMERVGNMPRFMNKRRQSITSDLGYPQFYTVQSNQLYVWPTPNATTADAFRIWYQQMPTAMICDAGYSLPVSPAHRSVYIYGVMWKLFQRARPSPHAAKFSKEYRSLFFDQIEKSMDQSDSTPLYMKPG